MKFHVRWFNKRLALGGTMATREKKELPAGVEPVNIEEAKKANNSAFAEPDFIEDDDYMMM